MLFGMLCQKLSRSQKDKMLGLHMLFGLFEHLANQNSPQCNKRVIFIARKEKLFLSFRDLTHTIFQAREE